MVTNILESDDCIGPGTGMQTTWTLNGSSTTYDGNLINTDGYMISAAILFQPINHPTILNLTNSAGEIIASEEPAPETAYGTCITVEYDEEPVNDGNFAICHWFYLMET